MLVNKRNLCVPRITGIFEPELYDCFCLKNTVSMPGIILIKNRWHQDIEDLGMEGVKEFNVLYL